MATKQRELRHKDTFANQRWRTTQDKLAKERAAHKQTAAELKEAQDIIAVLTQENLELGKINKDMRERFDRGGLAVAINDGYVVEVGVIPQYSEYTYLQDIPQEIGTKLYSKIPFIKLVDRQLTIDKTQKQKYERIRYL